MVLYTTIETKKYISDEIPQFLNVGRASLQTPPDHYVRDSPQGQWGPGLHLTTTTGKALSSFGLHFSLRLRLQASSGAGAERTLA